MSYGGQFFFFHMASENGPREDEKTPPLWNGPLLLARVSQHVYIPYRPNMCTLKKDEKINHPCLKTTMLFRTGPPDRQVHVMGQLCDGANDDCFFKLLWVYV